MSLNSPYTISAKDTVPASSDIAGTFSSVRKIVTGSGTSFTTLHRGAWLYDETQEEVRMIADIVSDTELVLFSAFTANASAEDLKVVTKDSAKVVFMEIETTGAVTIDGITYTDNTYTDGQPNAIGSSRRFARPVVVDPSANSAVVKLTMYGVRQ